MTGEMIQRVAQAIRERINPSNGGEIDPDELVSAARAAIEALREPTEAMTAAALHERADIDRNADTAWDFRIAHSDAHVWRAMIDAALKDERTEAANR